MSSFWLIIFISLLSVAAFIWFSVIDQLNNGNSVEKDKKLSAMILLPIILLCLSPIGYYYLGNHDKQEHWQKINAEFQDVVRGVKTDLSDSKIQDLLLALRTAADKDPKNGHLWFMLAESYFQLGMIDLADASMIRAHRIEMRPNWLVANAQILSARANESDIAKSINLLNQAISIQPNHQSGLLTLGFLYLRQNQYSRAIYIWKRLEQLLEKSGNDTQMIRKQIEMAENRMAEAQSN